MRKRRMCRVLCALTCVALLGMPAARAQSEPPGDLPAAINTLGWNALAEMNETGNQLISPLSLAGALSMCCAGAYGNTRAEMARLLSAAPGAPDLIEQWEELTRALTPRKARNDGEKIILESARMAFVAEDYALRGPYVDDIARMGAQLENVDFDGDAVARANQWVDERTHGLIPELLTGPLPEATRLMLMDALYFKAPWQDVFFEQSTTRQPFYAPGGEVEVDMMRRVRDAAYYEDDVLQMITIPYAGREYELLIVLPREGQMDMAQQLMSIGAYDAPALLAAREVDLALPRLSLEHKDSLNEVLNKLGVKLAFDPVYADFSGISEGEGLYLSQCLQGVVLKWDEAGTEAAGATAMIMPAKGMVDPPPPAEMRVDRPFFAVVRHAETRVPLFLARVEQPEG